ncbi:MAG: VirE protein [Bacteroidaceae bacterium]|nr:VirE protein [Bacteroidaceae bacterium]
MTFGISNSVKSQQVQICTPEMLREAIDSPLVAQVCAEIKDAWEQEKRGEITLEEFEEKKGRLKKQLPILTPHATFKNGRRLNADAVPSGLSMYDLDHIPDPEGRWREIEPRKDELGIVMAHITPSTKGLRLLFIIPQGMNLAQAQRWMAEQLGDQKYDECVKDYARCSFIVPRQYILYMSDKIWEDPSPTLPQGEGVITTDNGVDSHTPSPLRGTTPILGVESVTTGTSTHHTDCPSETGGTSAERGGGGYSPVSISLPYREGQGGSSLIVSTLEDQLGGIPTHGSRNNFIFTMACHLRYVCNDDPEWIARILPTYGENREKWMATIRSACNRNQTPHMSRIMQRVLAICKEREREEQQAEENPDLPPQMPRILPPLIRLLVSKTPDIYKPAVAHAVFPALATHLWQTRFRYIDNVEHEATLMNVLMAGTGAGKNCISEPINRIMADIRLRDAESLRREQEWKKEVQSKGANKDKRQRPEGLIIQEVDPDMTNAAFVQRLADAGERFLYTKMNEIDQFDALKGSARGKAQFQIMCLAFDPQNAYGQTRIGTGSVTEKVSIRFNWNASTTIGKGRRYFQQVLTDGPISRINFCTIPEREIGAEMPIYGVYDASFDEELRPYIENLNKARGLIDCPKARTLAKKLVEECADFSRLSQSRVYENLSYRANVIAYLKAMVLFVASGGKWDKTVENFIRWSLNYDLWCKMRFFGREIEQADNALNIFRRNGPQNMLDLLPDVFTRGELKSLNVNREMTNTKVSKLLYIWKTRGYIKLHGEEMPQDQKDKECYEKTEFYIKKFGSQKELV